MHMLEPRKMTLEDARRTYEGKPYSREITREIEATGYTFMVGSGKVTDVREPRRCARFRKK